MDLEFRCKWKNGTIQWKTQYSQPPLTYKARKLCFPSRSSNDKGCTTIDKVAMYHINLLQKARPASAS